MIETLPEQVMHRKIYEDTACVMCDLAEPLRQTRDDIACVADSFAEASKWVGVLDKAISVAVRFV
jgi:hypothetical protein